MKQIYEDGLGAFSSMLWESSGHRNYPIKINIFNYLSLLVICALAVLCFLPWGSGLFEKEPADMVTVKPIKMYTQSSWLNGDRAEYVVTTLRPGTKLKVYAVSGDTYWAEDTKGNRGYVPIIACEGPFYLLQDQTMGEVEYKRGTEVVPIDTVGHRYSVRTPDGKVGETMYPGTVLASAKSVGLPAKKKNECAISRAEYEKIFQVGVSTFEEVEKGKISAEYVKISGGKRVATYKYTVFDDKEELRTMKVTATFEVSGKLEEVAVCKENAKDYTLPLRLFPWVESLMDMPFVQVFSYSKALGKPEYKSVENITERHGIGEIKSKFFSFIVKAILLIIGLALLYVVLVHVFHLVPATLSWLLYIPGIPNVIFKLLFLLALLLTAEVQFLIIVAAGAKGGLIIALLLVVVNLFIWLRYADFINYNRCPECKRMYVLYQTNSIHIGTSRTRETTYEVTSVGGEVVDTKEVGHQDYETTSWRNYLKCSHCGAYFSIGESSTRRV